MRLTRVNPSEYETPADLEAQAGALRPLVDLVDPGEDAEIVVVSSSRRVGRELLGAAPSARLVVTTTSGTDHLDLAWMRAEGIAACRLPLARRDAVVEATLAMLLNGLRRAGELRERSRAGSWARADLPALAPRLLCGEKIGVVGLGVIGSRMAEVLRLLGATVFGADPAGIPEGVAPAGVEEMVAECAGIVLLCDLNPTSEWILSAARLAGAHPRLVVVNPARGRLLDVEAAVSLLREGRLGSVAVDVFPEEPYPRLRLASAHPDLWFTPHAAGYSDRLAERVTLGLVEVVRAFVSSEALPHRRA